MFRNFLKTAFRNLLRNKFYSLINIVGLAIGICACILILLYVQSEVSYDKFHEKKDRIYRINLNAILSDGEINQSVTCAPLAGAMQDELPEVEEAVRIYNFNQPVLKFNGQSFNETEWYFTDPNFFKIFTTEFILGNPENALNEPNAVVLTETTAQRYFGNENPVGQFLSWENDRDYKVTGVIKDFPENSHMQPDFLASILSQGVAKDRMWVNNMLYTYVLINEGYTKSDIDAKLEGLVTKYVGPAVKQYMGVSFDELLSQGLKYKWYAQPLVDIHFNKNIGQGLKEVGQGLGVSGNKSYMVIFLIIAFFILTIACINYMNMSTARSANRAKEVGIKKSLGSKRGNLISQFLSESVLVTLISVILAMILVKISLPGFNTLIDKSLAFNYFDNLKTIPLLLSLGAVVGLIAGIYPAFFLASFNTVKVLKGSKNSKSSHGNLRNGLVVFQLIVSIILFSGTFFITRQLNYLQNKELGFKKENLVVVNKANYLGNRLSTFKSELLTNAEILSVANTSAIPGRIGTSSTFTCQSQNDPRGVSYLTTDCDFADTYQIEIKEGRYFPEYKPGNERMVVLNESAVKTFNLEDPVGKKIYQGKHSKDTEFTIVGVMKDFHSKSLHSEIGPLCTFFGDGEKLTIRISGENIIQSVKLIERTWGKFANGQTFDYVFFDEDFGHLYNAEVRTRKLVTIFSVLAIVIACLGILGLAAFIAEQKTKEIGVRKVNGARIVEILFSLNRNFMKWVGIAFLIAVPGAWYLLNNWLQNFAYQTTLNWWVFALSGLSALIVTIITVSWISWKAASRNPVEALRYE